MRSFLQQRLMQSKRSPALVYSWEFWHDRQDRKSDGSTAAVVKDSKSDLLKYEDRLVPLADINDVGRFWEVYNNFDVSLLKLRDSIHLFHKGVKPVWEDPRNVRGGAWTFRVPKDKAQDFWRDICMMAIGEQLQDAIKTERTTFIDDICGVSLSVRFTSMLIQIWNRDGDHEEGIKKILETVLDKLPDELQPKNDGAYYYKKHSEHAGYTGGRQPVADSTGRSTPPGIRIEDKREAMEIERTKGMIPPGADKKGADKKLPPGDPMLPAEAALEDVDDTLRNMNDAMHGVAAKDKRIQADESGSDKEKRRMADEEMIGS